MCVSYRNVNRLLRDMRGWVPAEVASTNVQFLIPALKLFSYFRDSGLELYRLDGR